MALGLIYVKITGPYQNLVTAGDITYLELYQHIQKLDEYIGNICKKKTTELLTITDDLSWHVEEYSNYVKE